MSVGPVNTGLASCGPASSTVSRELASGPFASFSPLARSAESPASHRRPSSGLSSLRRGIDLAREDLHALHGLRVVEETGLPHDKQVTEAPHMGVRLSDLSVHRVRVAGEDEAAVHVLVEGRGILEQFQTPTFGCR
jgi:hypothetical protein